MKYQGVLKKMKTENLEEIRKNVKEMGYSVEKEININPNSGKMEFSILDPDGYYLIISEFHTY